MRLAARWLAECGAAPKGIDHYRLRDQMIAAGDHGGLQRYAYAYALAGDEARVRSRWNSWGAEHIAHFERLARAGYEPTPWEQARLAEAEACVQAAGTLACQACGCTGGDRCPVRYDRDNETARTRVRLGLHQAQDRPRPRQRTRRGDRTVTEAGRRDARTPRQP